MNPARVAFQLRPATTVKSIPDADAVYPFRVVLRFRGTTVPHDIDSDLNRFAHSLAARCSSRSVSAVLLNPDVFYLDKQNSYVIQGRTSHMGRGVLKSAFELKDWWPPSVESAELALTQAHELTENETLRLDNERQAIQIAELRANMAAAHSTISGLKAALETANGRIAELETRLARLEARP